MLTTSDRCLLGIAPCRLARANSQSSSSNYLAGTGGSVLVPRISRQLTSAGGACGSRAGVPDAIAASAARGLASAAGHALVFEAGPRRGTGSGDARHPGQGRSSSRLAQREDMQAGQSQPGSRRGDPANDEIASDSVQRLQYRIRSSHGPQICMLFHANARTHFAHSILTITVRDPMLGRLRCSPISTE